MRPDLLFVGAGLANGLLAYRLSQCRPDLSVMLLEQDARPGGNHTWSFHATDVTPGQADWLDPFVAHRWAGYRVDFPDASRHLEIPYRSVTSDRFADILERVFGGRLRCGVRARHLAKESVLLETAERIDAGAVIDGRGPQPFPSLDVAYQKFVGVEVRLQRPHGLDRPILMDATVPQIDGYRFVYVLPLAEDRLLVEDTYYANRPDLDAACLRARVHAYIQDKGWTVRQIMREETGILPITLDGDIAAFWREGIPGLPRTGSRAALFNPTTGYSVPDAVRLADHVCGLPDLSAEAIFDEIRAFSIRRWRSQRFFRFLNRMLFRAGSPDDRVHVIRRFYGLPEPLIRRFYAGALSPIDKARILFGKPPVPFLDAVRTLPRRRLQGS